jgi:hypothetical protein
MEILYAKSRREGIHRSDEPPGFTLFKEGAEAFSYQPLAREKKKGRYGQRPFEFNCVDSRPERAFHLLLGQGLAAAQDAA